MRDPKERLRDILDAIASIERYAARGREAVGGTGRMNPSSPSYGFPQALHKQRAESRQMDGVIRKNLEALGYGI